MLNGKNILIGISAGIAAYKICELIRLYKKNNAEVKVVMTESAEHFVTKLTVQTLSKNPVYVDGFVCDYNPEHISLCDWADVMVLAPATANTISKIANGICDNLLTSTVCAFNKPILIAPAMNTNMWTNEFVQSNIAKLRGGNNYTIIEPESGELACGTTGVGRLCSIEAIFDKTVDILTCAKVLNGKKVVITAGGTVEKIDPVRYISNFSSGKMGVALADVAFEMGADVTLVSTFDIARGYEVRKVQSALDMEQEVFKFSDADCVIMAAAVADFRVKDYAEQKIKKTSDVSEMSIELVKNPDILQEVSAKFNDTVVVGFCAESENLLENAKIKIQNKGCDYIVANDISRRDIGFSSDENEVYIIDKDLNTSHIEKSSKRVIARKILEKIFE